MEEVIIRGKPFSKQEIEEKGRQRIKKLTNLFRWLGVGLFAMGIIGGVGGFASLPADADMTTKIGPIMGMAMFVIAGAVLFVLSFKKRDPFEYGKAEIEKNFPAPLGFDGKVIDVLDGDKTIEMSKKPVARLTIDSTKKVFQLLTENRYSKIFTIKDLVDYEIKVDNEVVITSKTKTKKGVGKAVAGGLLFGEAGAIAGAVAGNSKSTTTSTQTEIHHYSLVVKVNDLTKPSFIINLDSVQIAEDVVTTFDILVGNTKKFVGEEAVVEPKPETNGNKDLDKFEELKKYKELLDAGIITQEEFDAKKKELLG